MRSLARATILFTVACIALAGEPAWAKKKDKNEQSATSDEMAEFGDAALGRMYHERIVEVLGLYENAELASYVQRIGEELAARAPGEKYEWHFSILDDDTVNAFALPGGYIYINRGLLAHLNSEAQLAAVLGHEIGHVTSRHAARQYTAAKVVGKVTGSIANVPGAEGGFDLSALFGAGLVRGYGREMELEADQTGAELVARLGYDPRSMLEVITVLKAYEGYVTARAGEDEEPSNYHAMLSSHPEKDRRTRELVDAASEIRADSARDAGTDRYLEMIDGLAFAGSTRQGVLRDNVFFHSALNFAITFPEGWGILNLPDVLVTQPPAGDAYMQIRLVPREKKMKRVPVDKFAQKFLGMTRWQNSRTLNLGGNPAFITTSTKANTGYGVRTVRLGVIYHGDDAYLFMGATDDSDRHRKYDREFVSIIESFRKLDETGRRLAEPIRIRTAEIADGTGMAELAARSDYASEELLRLLNGLYPEGEPAAGATVKYLE